MTKNPISEYSLWRTLAVEPYRNLETATLTAAVLLDLKRGFAVFVVLLSGAGGKVNKGAAVKGHHE